LRATDAHLAQSKPAPDFAAAVVDPQLNALLCACATARPGLPKITRAQHATLADIALTQGAAALTAVQASLLLQDPLALSRLHFNVWSSPQAHPTWHALTAPLTSEA
jgi:membrane glycosyltransferase